MGVIDVLLLDYTLPAVVIHKHHWDSFIAVAAENFLIFELDWHHHLAVFDRVSSIFIREVNQH